MDKSRIPIYAHILCCFSIHVVGAIVLSPTNVTLHCHNMQNTLQWTYDQLSDDIAFHVTVRSTQSDLVLLSTSNTSIDLSKFSEPDNEYIVQVSAVKGSEESEQVPKDGIEYSYFKDAISAMICNLDLPLVKVTREDKLLHFSFTHPGLLYPTSHKSKKKKSLDEQMHLHDFDYDVHIINQRESHEYTCSERVCQDKLPVHDSEEIYCLNISGEMNKMSVQATRKYCSEPLKASEISALAYILPIVLVVIGGLFIVSMVFVKKTKSMYFPPNSLNFNGSNGQPDQLSPSTTVNEFSPLCVDPPFTPIPPNQDTSNYTCPGEDNIRLPLGIQEDNETQLEHEEAAVPLNTGYSDGKYLDKDEEEPPLYEPRNTAVVNNV